MFRYNEIVDYNTFKTGELKVNENKCDTNAKYNFETREKSV